MFRHVRRRSASLERLRTNHPDVDAFLDYLECCERRQGTGQILLTIVSLAAGRFLSTFVTPTMLVQLLAR